jgi:hypothetical protein
MDDNLVRIPPEIGAMTILEESSPYTSRRLHPGYARSSTAADLYSRRPANTRLPD